MQYDIHLASTPADLSAIRDALCRVDPAAIADLDPATGLLRVSASLSSLEVGDVLATTDPSLVPAQIMALPSTCCGGCGG
ncbi:hypothetical protein [Arenimonas alkanexedens]